MSPERTDAAFLDRPAARLVALLVALAVAAVLAWIHRDDLVPGRAAETQTAAERAVAACYEERSGDIDQMVEEGAITAEQAALFKSRAEAMCRDTAEGGSGSPAVQ